MEKKSIQQGRIIYYDILRLIAIMAVVFMHATSKVFHQMELDKGSLVYYFLNVMHAITSFAVPLFIMISGALMLGRNLDTQRILKKYCIIC